MDVTLESLVQYATLVTVVTGFVSLVVFAISVDELLQTRTS
jgi:hypothetical protein